MPILGFTLRTAAAATSVLLLAAVARSVASTSPAVPLDSPTPARSPAHETRRPTTSARQSVTPCDARVLKEELLQDSAGQIFFLTPDVLMEREGALFIAGQASIRTPRGAAWNDSTIAFNDALVAIRAADGTLRTVARPAQIGRQTLRTVRAAALPDNRWALLLMNGLEPDTTSSPPAHQLWLAVLGPAGWERVFSLDTTRYRIRPELGDPLQVRDSQLLAVVPAVERASGAEGTLLLEGSVEDPRPRFLATGRTA